MAYTIEEALEEIERIKNSVSRNNDTIKIDTLIKWFNKNLCHRSVYEPPWDEHDTGHYSNMWVIDQDTVKSIDDMIDDIVKMDKSGN